MKRGDIFYADLNPVIGNEQGGLNAILVVQNNVGNRCSPTTIVAVITNKKEKTEIPTHVCIEADGLCENPTVLLEQIRTIDKARLRSYVNSLDNKALRQIDKALSISVGLELRLGEFDE